MTSNKTRRSGITHLLFRIGAFIIAVFLYFARPDDFDVLEGAGFFDRPSTLHIYWVIWIVGIAARLIPLKGIAPPGAQKRFGKFYKPTESMPAGAKHDGSARGHLWVALIWALLAAGVFALNAANITGWRENFLLTAALYALDLIFVRFYCPLREWIMKNRCCMTCRIYNWDWAMIFTPMLYKPGFYALSLILPAAALMIVWEAALRRHPERFSPRTNASLDCSICRGCDGQ